MADTPKSVLPEVIWETSIPQVLSLSRSAVAKKLGINEKDLPDGDFFSAVKDNIEELSNKIATMTGEARKKELAKTLSVISLKEATDKAQELWKDWLNAAQKLSPEVLLASVATAGNLIKEQAAKGRQDALSAVSDIVNANGDISKMTASIDKLTEVKGWILATLSATMKWAGDTIKGILEATGIMGFLRSLGNFLWFNIAELEKKKEGGTQKKIEEGVDSTKKSTSELLKKWEEVLKKPIDKEKILSDMSDSLGKLIWEKYFWKWVNLSQNQLEKIKSIIGKNLDITTLEKIRLQYEKDGTTRMGDVAKVNVDLMAKLPVGTFFDIALAGIIPTHKIIYNTIIEPSKNLIQLTFDWLPFVDMQMSMTEWSWLLSEKAKWNDKHALDLARVQLYAVNGLLWKTIGMVTSGIAAGWIAMLTDTVTWVNGFHMLWNGLAWNFDNLSRDIGIIESTLSGGSSPKGGSLAVLSDRLKWLQHNYLMLDLAMKSNEDPSKMMSLLKDDSKYLSLKQKINIADLEWLVWNKEKFQQKMAGYLFSSDVTQTLWKTAKIAGNKYIGGAEGSIRHYMDTTDDLLTKQKSMFLAGNIRNVLWTPLLALKNMKMARSADSVILHVDDAKDVSKLRAFLAVIPGWLKWLAELIPATSILFSIGSIAMDNKDKKDGVYGSMMDIAKTVFVPVYWSVSMLLDKSIDIKSMINEGKVPSFWNMALTGVIGWVALFETVRVANQVAIGSSMMYNWAVSQWAITIAKAPFRGVIDITNAAGSAVRGARNISALAKAPIANPAVTKALTSFATKVPKTWRFAIWGAALVVTGGAYAYIAGPENPEDIMKNLHKEGWLDIANNPTSKMKEVFQSKSENEKKNILDELLIMHLETNKNLPKTHYDQQISKYTIITGPTFTGQNLIDSSFRNTLQVLGVDIGFPEKA